MPFVLGYWDIRGLAQPIRLLLEYTGEEYEDKRYECGDAPTYDKSCWTVVKETLGLDFPNLPYLLEKNADGEITRKLTQSITIMRFLARRHNLLPETEEENIRSDIMQDETVDFRSGFTRLCYSGQFAELKDGYLQTMETKLKRFEAYMAGHEFVAGKKLTYVDFMFAESLDHHVCLAPGCLDNFPSLKAYHGRFFSLDKVKEYRASSKCIDRPLNNKMASFK